jgi:hypothetical protein
MSEVERVRLVSKTSSARSCVSFVYPNLEMCNFSLLTTDVHFHIECVRELRINVFSTPIRVISLILGNFRVHEETKHQDFSYLLVILFRFEAKCKPSLKLNLSMNPDPQLSRTSISVTS